MDAQRILKCGIEVICIIICLILLAHTFVIQTKREQDYWFRIALISNIGMMLGDLSDWILRGAQWSGAQYLFTYGIVIYFVSSGVVLCSFFAYIYTYLKQRISIPELFMKIVFAMMTVQLILSVITPFTGALFTISPQCVYKRGPFFPVAQLISAVVIGMTLILYLYSRNHLKRKEKIYFLLYLIIPSSALYIQVMNYGVALLNASLTLTFLLVNLFVTSELDDRLRKADIRLEQARVAVLEDHQRNQKMLVEQTIMALSNTVEAKDIYTNGHSLRVAIYSKEIVRRMGWNAEEQQKVYYAGLLHDVGKIRVPDHIINKAGCLTKEEYAQIQIHSSAGYYILKEISAISDFAVAARWHHERYDGKGYPNGLAGENIPLIARIIGAADSYDAMTSDRCYRKRLTQEQVREEFRRGKGTQFDPKIADIVLEMMDADKDYLMREPDEVEQHEILVVDRDPLVLEEIKDVLQDETSYTVTAVSSDEEALEVLREREADLILVDIGMEREPGFVFLQELRKRGYTQPVVFMSEKREIDVIRKAEQMGVSDYLTKPLASQLLKVCLKNVLTLYGMPVLVEYNREKE